MNHTLIYLLTSFLCAAVVGATRVIRSTSQIGDILCPDGRPGLVSQVQEETITPFQPAIYVTDCSLPQNNTHVQDDPRNEKLNVSPHYKRQSISKRDIDMCSAGCLNACSWSPSGAAAEDCSALTNYISSRASSFSVGGWQRVTATSGSCMTTFINLNILSVTWCDSTWATQAASLASECSTGGACLGALYQVIVELDPDFTPALPPSPPASTSTLSTSTPANTPTTSSHPATQDEVNVSSTSIGNENGNENENESGDSAASASIRTVSSFNGNVGTDDSNNIATSIGSHSTLVTSESTREAIHFYTSSISVATISDGMVIVTPTTASFESTSSCSPEACSTTVSTGRPSSFASNPGAIVAVIIGVVLIVLLFVGLMIYRRRRKEGQVIFVGPLEEEKNLPEVERIPGVRSPSCRAYTIESSTVADFGRALGSSQSPTTRTSVMLSGLCDSRVSYVPFWDIQSGSRGKGTTSGFDLDDDESSSDPSYYSEEREEMGNVRSSEPGHVRLSSYNPEGQPRPTANLEQIQSVRVSIDDGQQDQSTKLQDVAVLPESLPDTCMSRTRRGTFGSVPTSPIKSANENVKSVHRSVDS